MDQNSDTEIEPSDRRRCRIQFSPGSGTWPKIGGFLSVI